jgi:hypothetical protein
MVKMFYFTIADTIRQLLLMYACLDNPIHITQEASLTAIKTHPKGVSIYIYIYRYVCVCVCVYTYTHTHIHIYVLAVCANENDLIHECIRYFTIKRLQNKKLKRELITATVH